MPSSVTTALSNSTRSSSHRKSNSNSNAAAGSGNGAAGNGNNASAAGNANNTAAIGSASNSRVQAMAAAAAAAKASTPPAANAQQPTAQQTNASAANAQQPNAVNATQPPQHMRSPSEAMAAARNQPLADKLASLESMWVTSGQAARSPTPRRAAQVCAVFLICLVCLCRSEVCGLINGDQHRRTEICIILPVNETTDQIASLNNLCPCTVAGEVTPLGR